MKKLKRPSALPTAPARAALSAEVRARLASGAATGVEVGRLAGISKQRACKLLREGRAALEIVEERRGGTPGKRPHAVDLRENDAIHAADPRTLAQLQRAKIATDIERKRLDLDERRGGMIQRSNVAALFQFFAAFNAIAVRELLSLPAQLRDACHERQGAEIERIWDGELRRVLARLAADNQAAINRCQLTGLLEVQNSAAPAEEVEQR